MKIILNLLIILFLPVSILSKQVCLAPSGCKIEMNTGTCIGCVDIKPIIEKEVIPSKSVDPIIPVVKVVSPSKMREVSYKCCLPYGVLPPSVWNGEEHFNFRYWPLLKSIFVRLMLGVEVVDSFINWIRIRIRTKGKSLCDIQTFGRLS